VSRLDRTPPRFARALLEAVLPEADAGTATGDLDEEYARFALPQRGRRAADAWYWRQVLLSCPPIVARRAQAFLRGGLGLSSLASDVRFAARVLRRRPTFTFATVATLALGLGVNITVFTVVNAVLIRPLPFTDAHRLVRPLPDELFFLDSGEAAEFAGRMTTLESFASWSRALFLFSSDGEAEEVRGARVSWNHFDMLGTEPRLGRGFVRSDAASDDALILSHGLWVRRFGADPSVVGQTVDMFGRDMTVVGVMAREHVPMEFDWEAWRTLPLDPALSAHMGLAGNGRLRDGLSIDDAREEIRRVLPEIWAEGGDLRRDEERAGLQIAPLREWLIGDASDALWALAAATGFVLLLACANVSSLLFTQGGSREREFAVRSALGASRARMMRQRVAEVLLLGLSGGIVALGASGASLGWFRSALPEDLPRADAVVVSPSVLVFTLACAVFAALVAGSLPVLRSFGSGKASVSGATPGAGAGRERTRVRSALVATEMAVAVVLVVGAGLMIRTLASLRAVDPGFIAEAVTTVRPAPSSARYPAGPELEDYYALVSARLEALPGVSSVGAIQFLPMTPGGWWTSYRPEGRSLLEGENAPNTAVRVVLGSYFETMRIPLLRGRTLEARDGEEDQERVVVVNASFESEAFPGESALGRRVFMGEGPVRVVGVVADVRQSDLRTAAHPEMYVHFGQNPWQRMHMVVRSERAGAVGVSAVRAAVRSVDPDVSMLGPRPMGEVVGGTLGSARLMTTFLTLFGLTGLGLGAVGVYGVTAQTVAERRREIGVRIALGADSYGVASRTVLSGMVPVVVGVVAGLLASAAGTRLLNGLLFEVAATDPGTFMTAPFVLLGVAVLSLSVPAWRASRLDPATTLREE
jgi:putative ABC transport system permease protein